jgi:hypothetical protein
MRKIFRISGLANHLGGLFEGKDRARHEAALLWFLV